MYTQRKCCIQGVYTNMEPVLKQKTSVKKATSVITARIQADLHDSFKEYCQEKGLTISEAVKMLIEKEMESIQDVYTEEMPEGFFGTFELPAHRVERPEEQINTIRKEDLDPNDPLEAMMLKQYEMYGD